MNEKELNLDVGTDGVIRSIYSDDLNKLAEETGGTIVRVCRLSNVEWEELMVGPDGKPEKGWTIRAAHDPELALRWTMPFEERCLYRISAYHIAKEGELVYFSHREEAIEVEKAHYAQLMPPKEKE